MTPHAHALARAWRKAIQPLTASRVNSVARKLEPKLKRRFLAAVATMKGNVDLEALAESLRIQSAVEAMTALHPETWGTTLKPAAELLPLAFRQAGQVAASLLTSQLGIGISFNLTNPRAVQWARTNSSRLITEVAESVKDSVRAVISDGFTSGIAPRESARLIRDIVGLTDRQAMAVVNYRFDLLEAGRTADDVARLAERYGKQLLNGRALNISRTECLVGETVVDSAVIRAVHQRWYEGEIVDVRTERGRQFTATPNHPMLTGRGWVATRHITQGDYLICDGRQKDFRASSNQDETHPPSTLSEIFETTKPIGCLQKRHTTKMDFHGDGREGDVEIVRPDRELMLGTFAALYEPTLQKILSVPDLAATPFCSHCSRLLAVDYPVCFCLGSQWNPMGHQPLANRWLAEAEGLGNRADRFESAVSGDHFIDRNIADRISAFTASQTSLADNASDPCLAQADPARYFPRIQAGAVECDRVASVMFRRCWSGHVFNLSTECGYFTINNGVYTGNTISASTNGQQELWRQAVDKGLLDPDKTWREWIVTPDDRLCEDICAPMDNQQVGLEEPFTTGDGSRVMGPPAHVNCRCAYGLSFTPPDDGVGLQSSPDVSGGPVASEPLGAGEQPTGAAQDEAIPESGPVVYHGTSEAASHDIRDMGFRESPVQYPHENTGLGFFFSNSSTEAANYAGKNGVVLTARVSLANPRISDTWQDLKRDIIKETRGAVSTPQDIRQYLSASGHDGVVLRNPTESAVRNEDRSWVVAFNNSSIQVKKASFGKTVYLPYRLPPPRKRP